MLTTGSKLYFGLGTISLVALAVYGWGSHGGLLGAVTLGLYGGIGEHSGYVVLVAIAVASFFVGGFVIAFRDADAESVAQVAQVEAAPAVDAPNGNRYWPVLGAVAAGLMVVGLVDSTQLFLLGGIVGLVVLLEWMVSAWSDRATGDAAANRRIRNRIMYPLEIPVFGAIGVAAAVLCVSRVLLALPEAGSAIAAVVVAVLILTGGTASAFSPKAGRTVLTVVCVVAALGVLAGGIIGATNGERKFEEPEQQETKYSPPDRGQPVEAPLQQGGATTTTTAP